MEAVEEELYEELLYEEVLYEEVLLPAELLPVVPDVVTVEPEVLSNGELVSLQSVEVYSSPSGSSSPDSEAEESSEEISSDDSETAEASVPSAESVVFAVESRPVPETSDSTSPTAWTPTNSATQTAMACIQ
jgi:hypothetical protein